MGMRQCPSLSSRVRAIDIAHDYLSEHHDRDHVTMENTQPTSTQLRNAPYDLLNLVISDLGAAPGHRPECQVQRPFVGVS